MFAWIRQRGPPSRSITERRRVFACTPEAAKSRTAGKPEMHATLVSLCT
jgi:hypothetical protein